MNALLAQFIPEARELIETAGAGLLELERHPDQTSLINDVFRAVHTLKGSSGLFDVRPLTSLVHAAEDLLGDVRADKLALSADIVDELLESLDVLGGLIDTLEANEALAPDADGLTSGRIAALRAMREAQAGARPATAAGGPAAAPVAQSREPAPAWLAALPEAMRARVYADTAASGAPLTAWRFEPEEDCFFRGDDPLALAASAPGLVALEAEDCAPVPALDDLDPFSCWLRFHVLCRAGLDEIHEHTRYVYDRVQVCSIHPDDLVVPVGQAAGGEVCADFVEAAEAALAIGNASGLVAAVAALENILAPASFEASALRWLRRVLDVRGMAAQPLLARLARAVGEGRMPEAEDDARTDNAAPDSARSLAVDLLAVQVAILATATSGDIAAGRLEAVATTVRNALSAIGAADRIPGLDAALGTARTQQHHQPLAAFIGVLLSDLAPAAGAQKAAAPPAGEAGAAPAEARRAEEHRDDGKSGATRVLRVDQGKIDTLMNLVAELVVAKNGLPYLAKRAEDVFGSRQMSREIKDQFAIIDRIAQGLQVGVMSVRMMPVSQLFQRFPRLVRDTARKLDKAIELEIEGESTEADKNVLESLADPLIHIVRNSVDHGIEMPEARRAAGKAEHGTIRLAARQENDNVVIEVVDDGKGIDPEAVKAKALRTGLIDSEQAAQMSDTEAVNLVFAAGFSTRDQVSDLSGRSVGMDVVRTAVQRAGGEVWLSSRVGIGTTITLRLPLTMAVTRVVTVLCGDHVFGIPMDAVAETVKVARRHIHTIKDREAFVLRNAVVPLVRLAGVLDLPSAEADADGEEAVMVVQAGRRRVGVIVDGFRERLEVIVRPLDAVLAATRVFSGTALLGDGRVLLVLDPAEIM
ncbi:chemotaxis protein CheA [Blastochloris tepida]|uniref:Chemotaxis protein CheA n=1 Tax=Blastochloris tepida TaxID=2233851 RepID=A0A348FXC3_9HYPH|nr:chemotaxis protein CheA [Blastochloris tepida]BBF91956.1 chemotaxis protein CheA [Blastochloris tepida]